MKELTINENTTNQWQIGKNYEPDQRKLLPCTIFAKTVRDKFQKCDSGPCYVVDDDENFIIVQPEVVKTAWAHVLYNNKLNGVEAVIDRAEPRILTVSIKLQAVTSKKDQYVDLQLYFDDVSLCQQAKKNIDEKRKEYKINQLKFIETYIENLLVACQAQL